MSPGCRSGVRLVKPPPNLIVTLLKSFTNWSVSLDRFEKSTAELPAVFSLHPVEVVAIDRNRNHACLGRPIRKWLSDAGAALPIVHQQVVLVNAGGIKGGGEAKHRACFSHRELIDFVVLLIVQVCPTTQAQL